jgi:hypothetical protein
MQLNNNPSALPSLAKPSGSAGVFPNGQLGEMLVSELNPVYYGLLKAGKVFSISAAAINPTAFTGGAAGTPIFGIYNPPNSGVDVVLLSLTAGYRNTGTAAANASLVTYLVNQGAAAVTGTQTASRNMYSGSTTGSVAYCMVNTANTAALASNLVRVNAGVQAVATAAQLVQQINDDIKGAIIVAPGSYCAIGQTVALTAGSVDAALLYAEIPV